MDAQKSEIIKFENIDNQTEIIFALLEGAYYYLGLVDDKKEYNIKVEYYKQHVLEILQVIK